MNSHAEALAACSEKSLFLRYQRDDDLEAFEELYRRLTPFVRQFLVARRVAPAERQEDLIQEVWAKLHRWRGRYEAKFEPAQWLFVITRSVWLDDLKGKAGRATALSWGTADPGLLLVDPAPSAERLLAEDQLQKIALGTLTALPGDSAQLQSDVFRLRVFDERSFREIAETLGIKEDHSRQLFHRARTWVAQHGAEWQGAPSSPPAAKTKGERR